MKFVLLALLAAACATGAFADTPLFPGALTLEAGYGLGPAPPFPMSTLHALGSPLIVVGRIASVAPPFDDLLPPGPYELTYVFEGSTCVVVGNWDNMPCSGGEFADFQGGTLAVYLDATPDADFTNLATFHDGDVVLLAQTSFIYVADDDPYEVCPMLPDQPDIRAFCHIVGGLWFDRASNQGVGFDGISMHEMEGDVPLNLQSIGYVLRADGVVDLYGPVSVTPATWGAVKALYR